MKDVRTWGNLFSEGKILAFDDIGTLTVDRNYLEFEGKKYHFSITKVRLIKFGRFGRDFANKWVRIEYFTDDDDKKTEYAYFADGNFGGWSGFIGGNDALYEKIWTMVEQKIE